MRFLMVFLMLFPTIAAAQSQTIIEAPVIVEEPFAADDWSQWSDCFALSDDENARIQALLEWGSFFVTDGVEVLLEGLCFNRGYVDMRNRDTSGGLPCNLAEFEGEVPPHRIIPGETLALLLGDPVFRPLFRDNRLHIECARIDGSIRLNYQHITPSVALWDSHITGRVDLLEARFDRLLAFDGSTFEQPFNADRLFVAAPLYMQDGTTFKSWVDLNSARILGDLDADGVIVEDGLWLFDAFISGDLWVSAEAQLRGKFDVSSSTIGDSLIAIGSTFEGEFDGDDLEIGGNLFLRDGATFKGQVNLLGAKVRGNLEAGASTFEDELQGNSLEVGKSLFLRDGATFKGRVNLLNAKIGSNLNTIGSTFEGEFNGDSLEVGKSLFLRGGATFKGKVNLLNAKVGGNLNAAGSTFEDAFNGDSLEVGKSLFLRGRATFQSDVDLRNAKIDGNLETVGSTFEGELEGNSLEVGKSLLLSDGAVFKGDVNLVNAKVGGSLSAIGSTFEGELDGSGLDIGQSFFLRQNSSFVGPINLVNARVGSHLQFAGSTFTNQIDMTGASVGDELLVSSPGERHGMPNWGPEAKLILRNVEVHALQVEMAAWRRADGSWLDTDLTGFRYNRLGGLNAEDSKAEVNMADATSSDLINWITEGQGLDTTRYDPQPYEQLAQVLEASGAPGVAADIRFQRYEHKRRFEGTSGSEKFGLFISRWFIGHGAGTRPYLYLLGWFGALVLAGTIMAFSSRAQQLKPFMAKFWYSIENALPLVDLTEDYKGLDHGSVWAESFFHLQKILGFVLATVFIGALTLL